MPTSASSIPTTKSLCWTLGDVDWLSELFVAYDIRIDEAHMRWFYRAVNARDWRCGSCGGRI